MDRHGDGQAQAVDGRLTASAGVGAGPWLWPAIDAPEAAEVARAFVDPHRDAAPVGTPGWFLARCASLRVVLDARGRIIALGTGWPEVLGWSCERLAGRLVDELVHPGDRAVIAQVLEQRADREALEPFTTRLRHRQGGYRALRWQPVAVPEHGDRKSVV